MSTMFDSDELDNLVNEKFYRLECTACPCIDSKLKVVEVFTCAMFLWKETDAMLNDRLLSLDQAFYLRS